MKQELSHALHTFEDSVTGLSNTKPLSHAMSARSEYHYVPVDDRAAAWGFYLTTVGRYLDPIQPDLPHGVHPDMYMFDHEPARVPVRKSLSPREKGRVLPEFTVAFITDTHTIFESEETGVVEFDGPTMLFLFPGVWHRYRAVGRAKGWMTARWFGFNGDIAYRLLRQRYVSPETAVRPVAEPGRLAANFDRLVDRIAADPSGDPVLLSMHAMELLATCIESVLDSKDSEDSEDSEDELVARMLDEIWTGSHRGLNLKQLCEVVGVHRRTMDRRFRAVRGHSLLTEVNLCRCRRARNLLEATDLPVKNICWLAGFSNSEQMRVTFLQFVQMTPSQYRKSHRLRRIRQGP